MTIDDPITIEDKYAAAVNTSHLMPPSVRVRGDVDTLIAAAIAVSGNRDRKLALSLYRISLTGDRSSLPAAVEALEGWLLGARGVKHITRTARRALVITVIAWWFDPTCRYCNGLRFEVIEEASRFSNHRCPSCYGAGRRPLAREVPPPHAKTARMLVDRIDDLMLGIKADMAALLKTGAAP